MQNKTKISLYSNSKFKSINKNKILKEKKEGKPYLAGQPKQASAAQQQPEANPAAAQYLTQPTKETVHTVSVIKGRPTPSFSSPVAGARRRTSATSLLVDKHARTSPDFSEPRPTRFASELIRG
jgi:transcription elongation factor